MARTTTLFNAATTAHPVRSLMTQVTIVFSLSFAATGASASRAENWTQPETITWGDPTPGTPMEKYYKIQGQMPDEWETYFMQQAPARYMCLVWYEGGEWIVSHIPNECYYYRDSTYWLGYLEDELAPYVEFELDLDQFLFGLNEAHFALSGTITVHYGQIGHINTRSVALENRRIPLLVEPGELIPWGGMPAIGEITDRYPAAEDWTDPLLPPRLDRDSRASFAHAH